MQAGLALTGSPDQSNRYSSGELNEFSEYFSRKLQLIEHEPEHNDYDVEENEDGEEEFSFACTNPDGSPVYPLFDQSLLFTEGEGGDFYSPRSLPPPLKKLFVNERDGATPVGPYCEWRRKEGTCKKSNSTGFSKLWRLRDLGRRSSSDGKDAFVFFSSRPKKSENVGVKEKVKKTTVSAHELHYVKNRAMREEHKRRSYFPYRQGVVGVGFFTNVNGLSRNVHPY